MATLEQIHSTIKLLRAAFPRWTPETDTAKSWAILLEDVNGEELQAAALHWITTNNSPWPPSISEIRATVSQLRRMAAGVPDAFKAWGELLDMPAEMERSEVTGERNEQGAMIINVMHLKFSHPLIEQVARDMGWPKSFPGDNPSTDRAHFIRAYNERLENMRVQDTMLPKVREFVENKRAQLEMAQVAGKLSDGNHGS
jgi:hypothetical protein